MASNVEKRTPVSDGTRVRRYCPHCGAKNVCGEWMVKRTSKRKYIRASCFSCWMVFEWDEVCEANHKRLNGE